MVDKLKKLLLDSKFVLAFILLLATILRFYNLGFQSPWLDELHTMVETDPSLSFKEFYDLLFTRELMPHLYYLLARIFSFLIDDSIAVVRSISAIAGVLTVFAMYFLGKEMKSKKVGLIAALLMAINHFHIYYSQEARPYALLSLFTTVSFLYLIRFLKKEHIKSGLLYAVFAALMINTHFFGLFVLVSQALIILIYLKAINWNKGFFINSCISGIVILLLFIPSMPILFKISHVDSFWIPPPSQTFFADLFSVFFGKSEVLVIIALLLIIIYLVKVFNTKEKEIINLNNTYATSFVILSIWLFVTFVLPYIRSYTNVPMMLNRYFTSALPAIILILSMGISSIKFKTNALILGLIFVTFSFVNLFLVRDYYHKVTKTQFRELTSEIEKRNIDNSLIVYRMAWHMEYYFNDTQIIQGSLNNYINNLKSGTEKKENFWAVGAHLNPYEVTAQNQKYLDDNFYLVDDIELKDCWAKYYIYKNSKQSINVPLVDFAPKLTNSNLELVIKSNKTVTSKDVFLNQGKYRLVLRTKSKPNPPIENENAHIDVAINGKRIGGFYTSSKQIIPTFFDFELQSSTAINIQLTFGNDYFNDKVDRDLIIYGVSIEKVRE
ncbi:glycosyltransferase family 39 protein [Tamlana flava]|uniref:glycosyltransferase family 39 protein n=1 Tax=Tamlana flava TaxID=3158572 RepID=UPI00351B0DC1